SSIGWINQTGEHWIGRHYQDVYSETAQQPGKDMPLSDCLIAIDALPPAPGSASVGIGASTNREVGRVAHEDNASACHNPHKNGIAPTSTPSSRSSACRTSAGQNKTDAS